MVVCPPFWLLPRIETGDSFLRACCAPLLRPHPQPGSRFETAQTKSRQCRGKEEESDTACCIGTPEHCGLIRRDLVVCPPFWLLPRIETGDSFLWACCAPLLRPHPQGNVPAWAFAGRTFRRLWGMSVPFSLNAPLLCQTIVAILCGNFEQFANKRPAHEKRLLKSPHFSAV